MPQWCPIAGDANAPSRTVCEAENNDGRSAEVSASETRVRDPLAALMVSVAPRTSSRRRATTAVMSAYAPGTAAVGAAAAAAAAAVE